MGSGQGEKAEMLHSKSFTFSREPGLAFVFDLRSRLLRQLVDRAGGNGTFKDQYLWPQADP